VNWRRLNNLLHRDIGYLAVGLTVVYGVSGLAVNHVRDWNPSYRVAKTALQIEPIRASERDAIVREALQKLRVGQEPRNVFRPDPETLQLFFREGTYSIDLPTGQVIAEVTRPRPVLFELNQLHLNTPKRLWTWVADAYAVSLILLALTGMFVLKGRTGITGRGAWLTGAGVLIPAAYWVWHAYLS
jgi:uncharacterized protein